MHKKLQDLLKLTGDEQFPDSSELHGVLCAHSLKLKMADNSAADELARWLDLTNVQVNILVDALHEEHGALLSDDMDYQLYLPLDSTDLSLRTQSLAAWCGGFVSGIGVYEDWLPEAPSTTTDVANSNDAEVREAIADLSQIAKAGLDNEQGSQEQEQAFVEIVEYVRVAVLLIQDALNQPAPSPAEQPVLH